MRGLGCAAVVVILAGCSQSPYMQGYKIGHEKGTADKEVDILAGQIPPWEWDQNGKGQCPYSEDSQEWRDFRLGYQQAYRDAARDIFEPKPPVR